MTDTFDILQLGHPLLRQLADPVEDIQDTNFQNMLDKLLSFVLAKGGMGIAAPQVGISQQVFILSPHPNARYPYAPTMPSFFVINPEITSRSETTSKDWEGCLSLPGIRALVPRHDAVKVRYKTRKGETINTEYKGFIARVFQHEYDHLQGTVFLDRVDDTHEVMMEREWQRQIAKYPR
jgi:peptide deformylase